MSQSTPPSAAVQKIAVTATVHAAYATVFGRLGPLVKAAVLPLALALAISMAALTMGERPVLEVGLVVLSFVPYTIFGVAWHRLTLLGADRAPPSALPAWRGRHWRFFGYAIAMQIIVQLIAVTAVPFVQALAGGPQQVTSGSAFAMAALLLIVLSVPYVLARLSFVFPAAAVDERYGLHHSWSHTKGQGLRLIAALFLAAVPIMLSTGIVSGTVGAWLLHDLSQAETEQAVYAYIGENLGSILLVQAVLVALNFLMMAVLVSVVSLAFRDTTGWVPAEEAGPPVPRGSE